MEPGVIQGSDDEEARMSETVICLGLYGDVDTADREFEALKALGLNKHIALHDAAVVVRKEDGSVEVSERTKQHGAAEGAMLGAAVGLFAIVLPPVGLAAVAGGSALGAAAGDVGLRLTRGLSEHQAKELGAMLEKGEVSLVAIVDPASVEVTLDAMGSALETTTHTSSVSKEALAEAIAEARAAGGSTPS
jgi:uncharacterized membrane protein